jgi:hypothetical protein
MTAKIHNDVLERVETWPQEAQEELAERWTRVLGGGVYHPTPEEPAAIDEADFIGRSPILKKAPPTVGLHSETK